MFWRCCYWNSFPKYPTFTEELCFNSKFTGSCGERSLENKPNNNNKTTSLEDNGLKMLMWISSHKNPLIMNDVKRFLKNGEVKRNFGYLLVIYKSKNSSFHCNSFSKFAFVKNISCFKYVMELKDILFFQKSKLSVASEGSI